MTDETRADPIVSAVIPTFGRPELLRRAVDSALAQTLAAVEVIVVIDGDDPPTRAALAQVADPRLRVISHASKRGPGGARDTGAAAAAGRWVAFLDDDDEWRPDKLAKQIALAGEDRHVLVTTLSHVVTPGGTFVRPLSPYAPDRPIDEWLFDRTTWTKGGMTFLQTSSLMLPRALFDRLHFSDSHQHEDWELVIRAVKQHGHGLLTVPEPLTVHYENYGASLSKQRTWRHSLGWIDGLGDLVTPRAYSGFLLNEIGRATAEAGTVAALPTLLKQAFARGRPTPKQLFRFGLGWAMPTRWRRAVRSRLQAVRPGAGG